MVAAAWERDDDDDGRGRRGALSVPSGNLIVGPFSWIAEPGIVQIYHVSVQIL